MASLASGADHDYLLLTLAFKYMLRLSPGVEFDPRMDLYMTRDVSNSVIKVDLTKTPPRGDRSIHQGTIKVSNAVMEFSSGDYASKYAPATTATIGSHVNAEQASPADARATVATQALQNVGHACLMVHAWTKTANKHGEMGAQQKGVAKIPLADIFDDGLFASASRVISPNKRYRIVHPMLEKSISGNRAEPPDYDASGQPITYADGGWIEIARGSCSLTYRGKSINSLIHGWTGPPNDGITSPLEDYILKTEREFGPRGMPPTFKSLERLDTFAYITEDHVEPAPAFCYRPPGHTLEKYFTRAAKIAIARMNAWPSKHKMTAPLTKQDVLAWKLEGPDANREHARLGGYLLATLLSLTNQQSDYFEDIVYVMNEKTGVWSRKPVESFCNPRLRFMGFSFAGDCEDFGLEFMLESGELVRIKAKKPITRVLQTIKKHFITFMTLTGISGAEIADASGYIKPDADIGSHMNCMLISLNRMRQMTLAHEQYTQGRSVDWCSEHMGSPERIEASKIFDPVVVLEGTGPLDPEPTGETQERVDDEGEEILSELINRSDYVSIRLREMFYYSKQGKSSFYVALKAGMTNEFLYAGCGYQMWTFAQLTEMPEKSGKFVLTSGVPFSKIASSSSDVMAVARPPFTPEQMALMHKRMLNMHPTPSLVAANDRDILPYIATAKAQIEQLEKHMANIIRKGGGKLTSDSHFAYRSYKFKHFDADGVFLRELISLFNKDSHVLVKFENLTEHANHSFGGGWFFWYWE